MKLSAVFGGIHTSHIHQILDMHRNRYTVLGSKLLCNCLGSTQFRTVPSHTNADYIVNNLKCHLGLKFFHTAKICIPDSKHVTYLEVHLDPQSSKFYSTFHVSSIDSALRYYLAF